MKKRTKKLPSPFLQAVYDILADGQQHSLSELLSRVGPLIPEDKALRTYAVANRNRKPGLDPRSHDERVAFGRRAMLRQSTWTAANIGIRIVNGEKFFYYHKGAKFDPDHRPAVSARRSVMGGRPASPELQRAYEVLADGEWHNILDVMAEVARVISPGRALRYRERSNERQREIKARRRNAQGRPARAPAPRPDKDIDHQIAVGRGDLARRVVKSSKKIDHRTDESGHYVRLLSQAEIEKRIAERKPRPSR